MVVVSSDIGDLRRSSGIVLRRPGPDGPIVYGVTTLDARLLLSPPQMPYGSSTWWAQLRQAAMTGQSAQIGLRAGHAAARGTGRARRRGGRTSRYPCRGRRHGAASPSAPPARPAGGTHRPRRPPPPTERRRPEATRGYRRQPPLGEPVAEVLSTIASRPAGHQREEPDGGREDPAGAGRRWRRRGKSPGVGRPAGAAAARSAVEERKPVSAARIAGCQPATRVTHERRRCRRRGCRPATRALVTAVRTPSGSRYMSRPSARHRAAGRRRGPRDHQVGSVTDAAIVEAPSRSS